MSKPSGGIHPDDTDVNILSTSRATGLNLEMEVCILSAKSIKMTLALGTRSQALVYLILVHQTGEGTLTVVESWKVKHVSQMTSIAESIDLHS